MKQVAKVMFFFIPQNNFLKLSCIHPEDLFGLKERLVEMFADGDLLYLFSLHTYLVTALSAGKVKDPPEGGALLFLLQEMAGGLPEAVEACDPPAGDDVEGSLHLFRPALYSFGVLQACEGDQLVDDLYLLPDAVDENEMALGEKNGQRQSRQAAAGTHIDDRGICRERKKCSRCQGVKEMVLPQVSDIFPGDHIDTFVPERKTFGQCFQLLLLMGGELREVFTDEGDPLQHGSGVAFPFFQDIKKKFFGTEELCLDGAERKIQFVGDLFVGVFFKIP